MLSDQLTLGDIVQSAMGELSVVTRNCDTDDLWLVSVSGYGQPEIRALRLAEIHPANFWMEFRPVQVKKFDELQAGEGR